MRAGIINVVGRRLLALSGMAAALVACGVDAEGPEEHVGLERQALVSLTPSEDAYVHESNPSSNYGSATSVFVKTDPGTSRYAYVKFNLAGVSGVTNARLRVYGSASAATTLTASQTTDTWTEAALT